MSGSSGAWLQGSRSQQSKWPPFVTVVRQHNDCCAAQGPQRKGTALGCVVSKLALNAGSWTSWRWDAVRALTPRLVCMKLNFVSA